DRPEVVGGAGPALPVGSPLDARGCRGPDTRPASGCAPAARGGGQGQGGKHPGRTDYVGHPSAPHPTPGRGPPPRLAAPPGPPARPGGRSGRGTRPVPSPFAVVTTWLAARLSARGWGGSVPGPEGPQATGGAIPSWVASVRLRW